MSFVRHGTSRRSKIVIRLSIFTTVLLFGAQTFGRARPQHAVKPPSSGRAEFRIDAQYSSRQYDDEELQKRIAILEASRADLGVWATIFIGVVALLTAANVSVWRVGSNPRKEADRVIDQYNKRFAGFLTSAEQEIQRLWIDTNLRSTLCLNAWTSFRHLLLSMQHPLQVSVANFGEW